jgi:hypothetical protein
MRTCGLGVRHDRRCRQTCWQAKALAGALAARPGYQLEDLQLNYL